MPCFFQATAAARHLRPIFRRTYSEIIPIVPSHVPTNRGHSVMDSFVWRSPNPWPPCAYKMHLHGHAGVLQRDMVDQRLVDAIDVVILRLQQERGWRLTGDMNVRVQLEFVLVDPRLPG